MMAFEGSELIGLLIKTFVIVLLSGIIIIPLVPVKIKSIISIIAVFFIALITSILAISSFPAGSFECIIKGGIFFGEIPIRIDALSAWFILIINFTSLII